MSLLQPGDTVGFVATSSGLEDRNIAPAVNYFEQKLHLKVKQAPNLSYAYRYMAGTDAERGKCLTEMYRDPEVKALFAIRGAGGSSRMLNFLDYDIIARHSKPLFGLSDVTAVQNALIARASTPAYTGFLPVYDIKDDSLNPKLETSLKDVLFAPVHHLKSGTSLYPGKAEGQIVGGCLTSFLYLAGTGYMPDLAGKVLLIEDTDEKRKVEGAVEVIHSSLKYFGIEFDEGADLSGDYGPYYQRQRAVIYHAYAKELIRKGLAYPCFCTEEDLEKLQELLDRKKAELK